MEDFLMKRMMFYLVIVLVMLFSVACGSPTPAPTAQAPATQAPAPQAPATQAPAPTAAGPAAAATQPTAPTQASVPTEAPPTVAITATNAPLPDSVLKLTGTVWQWARSTDNSGKETKVAAPQKYTLQFFLADGKVAVKADCNNATGSFTADAQNLSISLGPTTLAACPPGSLSDQFIKELGEVQTYLFDGADLILGRNGGGSMRFTKAGSARAPTATAKPGVVATVAPKPATTLDFNVDLVGCREAPTIEKPGGIVLLFRFEPTGAPGPYRYFDVDAGKEVTELYERPAEKGSRVIVTWAVQSADGQRRQKKQEYAASRFADFGCS
jgi:heat shock protein HslJ